MGGPLVFISHSSIDAPAAERIEAGLVARGLSCWLAPRDIEPGEPFDEAIDRAIGICDAVLLLVSDEAAGSRHVKRELIIADKRHKTIIPLRLEPIEPQKLAYHLADAQWIDWQDGQGSALDRVAARVRRLDSEPTNPERAAIGDSGSNAAGRRSARMSVTAVGTLIVLVLVVAGFLVTRTGSGPQVLTNANTAAADTVGRYLVTPDRGIVSEGDDLRVTVTRSGALPAATFSFSLFDEADKPLDEGKVRLRGGASPLMVPVSFNAGENSKVVDLHVPNAGGANGGTRFYAAVRDINADSGEIAIGERSPIIVIDSRRR